MVDFEYWGMKKKGLDEICQMALGDLPIIFYHTSYLDYQEQERYLVNHCYFNGETVIFHRDFSDNPNGQHRYFNNIPEVWYCRGEITLDHTGNVLIAMDGSDPKSDQVFAYLWSEFNGAVLFKYEIENSNVYWFMQDNIQVAIENPSLDSIAGKFILPKGAKYLFSMDITIDNADS